MLIGHYTTRKGYVIDASTSAGIRAGRDYTLTLTLKGSTVSAQLNGRVVLGYAFNAVTVDGGFGLMTRDGSSSFDSVTLSTDDPAYLPADGSNLLASLAPSEIVSESELESSTKAALEQATTVTFIGTSGHNFDSQFSGGIRLDDESSLLRADTNRTSSRERRARRRALALDAAYRLPDESFQSGTALDGREPLDDDLENLLSSIDADLVDNLLNETAVSDEDYEDSIDAVFGSSNELRQGRK